MKKVQTYDPALFATVKDGATLAGSCYLTALKKVNASGIEPMALHSTGGRGRPSPLYKRSEVEEALGLVDVAAEAEDILAAAQALVDAPMTVQPKSSDEKAFEVLARITPEA